MGIDAKDIQACICRILQFSINTSYRFVQRHPFVFGVFFFFFLLYIFLPFILNFLAYSSPFLVCIAILLRIFWSSEKSHIQSVKKDEKKNNGILHKKSGSVEYDLVVNRNDCSSLPSETSRRRNVKEKNKELDVQTGKEEEDMVLQTASNEDSIRKTVIEEKEGYSFEHGESSSANLSAAEDIPSLDKHRPFLYSEHSESELTSSDGAEQARKFDVAGIGLEAVMSSDDAEQARKFDVAGIGLEADNLEEADDDDEEAREDRNKAVEWTEDDQKNLMDLGFSEIERNKRLESLIVKRRARKLSRLQVEKDFIDKRSIPSSQISLNLVARNNTVDLSNILDGIEGLEVPDSAPSILFPSQNPFDLPYDPLEEKPNLMGDSFHQEFMAGQKETLFCRHESFSLEPSFPLKSKQNLRDKKFSPLFFTEKGKGVLEGPGYPRFKRRPNIGDHDQLIEKLLYKEGDRISHIDGTPDLVETEAQAPNQVINSAEMAHVEDTITKNNMIDIKGEEEMERPHGMESKLSSKGEVYMEPYVIEGSSDESDSLSSSEENVKNFNAYVAGVLGNEESNNEEANRAQRSVSCPPLEPESEPSYDSSPSANEKNRRDSQNFFAGRGSYHTPTYSIASDLQVEVSEVGSPPLTVDGTNSPTDGESLTYDEEIEKEITYGSEEMWGVSSHQSGVEEKELKSRGIHEVSQEDIAEVGLSQTNKTNSKDVVVSSIYPQQVDDQELTDVSSLSSTIDDLSGESQAQSINIDHKIHDDVEQVVEGVWEPKSKFSNSSDPSSTENLEKAMQLELVPCSLQEVYSEKPEDLSYPHEMSTREVNAVYEVNHTSDHATFDMEELKMNEDANDGWQLVNKQETEKPTEHHQAISDSVKAIEGNSKPIEDVEGNQVKLTEKETIMDTSKPIEANEYFKSTRESEGEQSSIASLVSGASGVNQIDDDPIASASKQELVIEEVTTNSSPSSSPKFISIQESGDEQSVIASGASGANQNPDDPIASAAQQELVIEDVPISSSSPKSVLAEKVPIDQASSSNVNQKIRIDILQSNLEDTTKTITLDEQPPLNLAPENLKSIQDSGDEQSVIASGGSGVTQNFDDPVSSAAQQELVIEDVPINSSFSSPRSVLAEKIPIVQASSSNSNQNMHIDILRAHLEDTEKTSTLDGRPPLNLTLTAPQNAQHHVVEDSTAHPSINRGFEILLELSNPPEKSTEKTNTVDNLNELRPKYDKDGKENSKSYEAIKGESETWISHEASTGLSKPAEDSNNILGTMEPGKFTAEANTIYKVNDPVVSENEDNEMFKSVEKSEGESQSLIKPETILEPPGPVEPTNSKLIMDVDEKSRKFTEGEALLGPSKSLEGIDNSRTKEETEDSGKLNEHDTIIHLPKSADIACNLGKSENFTECEAVDLSKPAVEKGYPDVPATIVEEDPSNPLPVKSTPESRLIIDERHRPAKQGKGHDRSDAMENYKGESQDLVREDIYPEGRIGQHKITESSTKPNSIQSECSQPRGK